MSGHPTFNQEKLTKRAKRSVGFVLQACVHSLMPELCHTVLLLCNQIQYLGSVHLVCSLCSSWQAVNSGRLKRWGAEQGSPCAGRPVV